MQEPVQESFVPEVKEETIEEPMQEEISQQVLQEPIKQEISIEPIQLTDDLLIEYLVNCDRESKEFYFKVWSRIEGYLSMPQFAVAAKKIRDTSVCAAGENCIIIQTDYTYQAQEINSIDYYFKIQDLLMHMFNKKMYVIAIDKIRFDDIKVTYRQLFSTHSLPEKKPLKDLYTKEDLIISHEKKLNEDPAVEKSKSIFGDLLEIDK